MAKNDRYTSIFWGLFGLYIALEGKRLEIGSFAAPKPGFMIFWAGITLSILSVILFIHTFFYAKKEKRMIWKDFQWSKAIELMVSLTAYALLFEWLGFILSTFLLLLFIFKKLGHIKWQLALILSVISIFLTYLIFGIYFGFHFPMGILNEILGLL